MKSCLKLIIMSLFLLLNCSNNETQSETTEIVRDDLPDQESWNAQLTITNEGKKVGVVNAGHIKKYSSKKLTLISEGVKVDFFNNMGEHTSVLTSKGGEVKDQSQNMIAYGNVVVVSDSGLTLFTDTLLWDNEKQKIISEIPVKITSDTDTLYGDSFISDPNLENYEITNSRGVSNQFQQSK